jgi:moderate conductance mechanosensitive channel
VAQANDFAAAGKSGCAAAAGQDRKNGLARNATKGIIRRSVPFCLRKPDMTSTLYLSLLCAIALGIGAPPVQLAQAGENRPAADKPGTPPAATSAPAAAAQTAPTGSDSGNTFTLANLWQWTQHHGPRVVLVLLGMLVLSQLVRLFTRQVMKVLSHHAVRCGEESCENRARTLIGVFRNAASLVICVGGSMMLLDEMGVPIMPLLGGAAVAGLAVAFGAQNLIRDYFCGFMVLLEDQYSIGDVVKIGDVSGTVEKITLRMTVLRDLEGAVHFVPHGTITLVSNMTHGWSQAHFEIGVAYKEDVDRVMEVLLELAREMHADPVFATQMLAEPEMRGVSDITDSAVIISFIIKTRPLKQWSVKREMLRRIKRRFDELGIEMPFQHRTIYHRLQGNDQARYVLPALRTDEDAA